jgi:peroxiredoxin
MPVTHPLSLGAQAPEFELPGVDGRIHRLADFQSCMALVVIFTCNHCPYVRAYEERIKHIQRDYEAQGVQVIAINANETDHYPEDNFEKMVLRAKEKGFNFPYLRDAEQRVATAYGATHTPQVFLFDQNRKLCYTGRIDDNWQDPSQVQTQDLRRAIDEVLADQPVSHPQTPAIGCTIKWFGT